MFKNGIVPFVCKCDSILCTFFVYLLLLMAVFLDHCLFYHFLGNFSLPYISAASCRHSNNSVCYFTIMSFHAVNVCTLAKVKVVAVMFAVKKDFLHILSGRQGEVKVEFNGKTFAAFLLAFHVLLVPPSSNCCCCRRVFFEKCPLP